MLGAKLLAAAQSVCLHRDGGRDSRVLGLVYVRGHQEEDGVSHHCANCIALEPLDGVVRRVCALLEIRPALTRHNRHAHKLRLVEHAQMQGARHLLNGRK